MSGMPYTCSHEGCGKEFMKRWSLTRHQRTHTGYKPFRCSFCSKEFVEKCGLDRHEQTHQEEKLWTCDVSSCGKRFKLKEYLDIHKRSWHFKRDTDEIKDETGEIDCSPTAVNKLRLQIVKARVQHRQLEIRYSEHIRDLRSSLSNACALLHRSAEALGGQTSGMKKDGEAVASPESLKEEILVLLQEVEKMNSDHTYCKRELAETISSSDGPVLDPGGSMTADETPPPPPSSDSDYPEVSNAGGAVVTAMTNTYPIEKIDGVGLLTNATRIVAGVELEGSASVIKEGQALVQPADGCQQGEKIHHVIRKRKVPEAGLNPCSSVDGMGSGGRWRGAEVEVADTSSQAVNTLLAMSCSTLPSLPESGDAANVDGKNSPLPSRLHTTPGERSWEGATGLYGVASVGSPNGAVTEKQYGACRWQGGRHNY